MRAAGMNGSAREIYRRALAGFARSTHPFSAQVRAHQDSEATGISASARDAGYAQSAVAGAVAQRGR
jgi:hypothetical protein